MNAVRVMLAKSKLPKLSKLSKLPKLQCIRSCTCLGLSYRVMYTGILLTSTNLALLCSIAYACADVLQWRDPQMRLQIIQAVSCVIVAMARQDPFVIWLSVVAAVVHFTIATVLKDLHSVGDCRRCCNEARACTCGNEKDPLPPGTLKHLATLVERHYSNYVRHRM